MGMTFWLAQTKAALARVEMLAYIQDLAVELFQVYGVDAERISLNITVEQMRLNIHKAIPCGLILQELISNCLKHAFPPDTPGEIYIELRSDSLKQSTLIVRDTGIGLPQAVDFRDTRSLGLQLVNLLTQQLHGTIRLDRHEGTTFTITFAELLSKTRVPATGS